MQFLKSKPTNLSLKANAKLKRFTSESQLQIAQKPWELSTRTHFESSQVILQAMANQNCVCINKAQKRCLYVTQRWAGTLHVILADAWEPEQD